MLTGLATLAPVLVGAGLWVLLLASSTNRYERLATELARETHQSIVLLDDLNEAGRAGREYLLAADPAERRAFRRAASRVDRWLAAPPGYDEPAERFAIVGIERPWRGAKRLTASGPARDRAPRQDGAGFYKEDRFGAQIDDSVAALERLMSGSQAELTSDIAAAQDAARLNWLLGLVAVALALLAAALVARGMGARLTRPLEQLAEAARSLAAGHLGHRVSIESTAELNEVGSTFNAMAEALAEQRDELERHAFADSLTGLANRPLFEDRTQHALERLAENERVAVLVVDLDAFKLVNDGLGHSCGDALLRQAGERMAAAIRPSDTLARLGSDEFAVVLEAVRGPDDALTAADRVRKSLGEPFSIGHSDVHVTASVGIALSTTSTEEASELLRRADMATHRVKHRGGNGVEFFDPTMDDRAAGRLEMVNALRGAERRGELVLHYQPIFDMDNGEIRAAEALLRWDRPGYGIVPPLDFVPLAEETGVIVPLGAWVLREACAEAMRWRRAGIHGVPVTANVSARQLLDSRFESVVTGALRSTGLAPEGLVLEVTESSVMQNAEAAIAKLGRISAGGVRIALDDFGEGYSSLSQLRALPIDILKLSRPFVAELMDEGSDAALLRGIVELARSLRLRLVAEGIEYAEQQALLRALDCPLGQGFLFSRPLEPVALRELLAQRQGSARSPV
jgi:diguanylate cyclase (GGDEF)-like protein